MELDLYVNYLLVSFVFLGGWCVKYFLKFL